MSSTHALAGHRRRRRDQGFKRLEVQVRREDAALVRAVAAALADPRRAAETRAMLQAGLGTTPSRSLKALLAAAPLDGVDLDRSPGTSRSIDL